MALVLTQAWVGLSAACQFLVHIQSFITFGYVFLCISHSDVEAPLLIPEVSHPGSPGLPPFTSAWSLHISPSSTQSSRSMPPSLLLIGTCPREAESSESPEPLHPPDLGSHYSESLRSLVASCADHLGPVAPCDLVMTMISFIPVIV